MIYSLTNHGAKRELIRCVVERTQRSPQGDKLKKRDISNGAKETITKLIKSTRRALNPSKETVKSVVAAA